MSAAQAIDAVIDATLTNTEHQENPQDDDGIIVVAWTTLELETHFPGAQNTNDVPSFPTTLYDNVQQMDGAALKMLPVPVLAAAIGWDIIMLRIFAMRRPYPVVVYEEDSAGTYHKFVVYAGGSR